MRMVARRLALVVRSVRIVDLGRGVGLPGSGFGGDGECCSGIDEADAGRS